MKAEAHEEDVMLILMYPCKFISLCRAQVL